MKNAGYNSESIGYIGLTLPTTIRKTDVNIHKQHCFFEKPMLPYTLTSIFFVKTDVVCLY